ncbi:uncharacterized protein LOC143258669 [Tachypleus tridentatus]|uniref:uncharacterized protein LOC143258669 n=1 Tax=Tachypleus tridentatus TaxID=6853 RepID=UPI003FD002D9
MVDVEAIFVVLLMVAVVIVLVCAITWICCCSSGEKKTQLTHFTVRNSVRLHRLQVPTKHSSFSPDIDIEKSKTTPSEESEKSSLPEKTENPSKDCDLCEKNHLKEMTVEANKSGANIQAIILTMFMDSLMSTVQTAKNMSPYMTDFINSKATSNYLKDEDATPENDGNNVDNAPTVYDGKRKVSAIVESPGLEYL